MMQAACVDLAAVSKSFRLYRKPADRLKEIVMRRPFHRRHIALDNISLRVEAGEAVGVIGRNGAGKSTLLKLVMGVLLPDSGRVEVQGRTTGLLELGTGFDLNQSGRENIAFNGILLGMAPEEIAARREAIIDFAELGDFIDNPVKTYSSGMLMRLAFAIAIHASPQCLVVDEALAVGDSYFQQKCMRHIHAFRDQGGSILLVSHEMESVKSLCNRALMLKDGRIQTAGDPKAVVDYFQADLLHDLHEGDNEVEFSIGSKTVTTGQIEVTGAGFVDSAGRTVNHVTSEDFITFRFTAAARKDVEEPHYGFSIRDRLGRIVFETNTYCMSHRPAALAGGGPAATVAFRFRCILAPGDYSVSIGIANVGFDHGSFREYLLMKHEAAILKVLSNERAIRFAGFVNLQPECSVT